MDLTDTDKGLQLWSKQFERKLTYIFAVQDEITRDITGALAMKLTRIELDRVLAKETLQLDAYDYYLRGLQTICGSATGPMCSTHARCSRRRSHSIRATPQPFPHLVGPITSRPPQDGRSLPATWLVRAEAFARQALSLSPELGDAHQLLGFVCPPRGEYDRALVEIRRAIEINPQPMRTATDLRRGRP